MTWQVSYHPSVRKDFKALGRAEAQRILSVIDSKIIHGQPDKLGKPLRGSLAGCRRFRVGNTRIVYRLNATTITVLIIAVGHRKDAQAYRASEQRVE